jgi:hypothetical protein
MRAHTEGKDEMGKRFAIVASATQGRSATWISSIALVVMVLGAAWLAAAPQAAEARPSPCGGGPQKYKSEIDDFMVRNVSCNYAKRVASHHIKTGDRRFNGWHCDDDEHGKGVDTTCSKGKYQRIHYSLKRRDTRHAALGAQTATSSTGEPVDSTPPDLKLSGKKTQHEAIGARTDCGQKRPPLVCGTCDGSACAVRVKASCGDEACTARVKGKVTKVKHDKLVPDEPPTEDLAPGETEGLDLNPTKKTRTEAGKALDDGKNVEAKVTVRAKDAAGNVATAKITIRLGVAPG